MVGASRLEALSVDLQLKIAERLDGRALAALESVSTHFAEKKHSIAGDVSARVTIPEQVDDGHKIVIKIPHWNLFLYKVNLL